MEIIPIIKNEKGPVILWIMHSFNGDEIEKLSHSIVLKENKTNLTIYAIEIEEWNDDLSLWEFTIDNKSFAGNASKTLEQIKNELYEKYKQDKREIYILGYSLAGLFALWTLTQLESLAGVATCSGSLWYPHFLEYIRSEDIIRNIKNKRIYISLGNKEKRTKDKYMSQIENCTMEIKNILQNNNDVFFEMNPGGHFFDLNGRLEKSIKWILNKK